MKTLLNKTGIFLLIVLKHIVSAVLFVITLKFLFDYIARVCIYVFQNFSWFDWSGGSRINPLEEISVERLGIFAGIIILVIGLAIIGAFSYFIKAQYSPYIAAVLAHMSFIYMIVLSYDNLTVIQFIIFFIVMYITTWIAIAATTLSLENT